MRWRAGLGRARKAYERLAAAPQAAVIAAAPTRGWSVEQGRAAAERRFPARLEMARLRPDVCDLVVRGNRADFVAESWSATRFNLGAVIGFRTRLCLVRVPAPAAVSPVVIGALPRPNLDVMTPASVTTGDRRPP